MEKSKIFTSQDAQCVAKVSFVFNKANPEFWVRGYLKSGNIIDQSVFEQDPIPNLVDAELDELEHMIFEYDCRGDDLKVTLDKAEKVIKDEISTIREAMNTSKAVSNVMTDYRDKPIVESLD